MYLNFNPLKQVKFHQIYVDPVPQVLRFPKLSLIINIGKSMWLKVDKFKKMFPKNSSSHDMSKRNFEFYRVNRTLTERYMSSAIPQMQRMLNSYQKKKFETSDP